MQFSREDMFEIFNICIYLKIVSQFLHLNGKCEQPTVCGITALNFDHFSWRPKEIVKNERRINGKECEPRHFVQ